MPIYRFRALLEDHEDVFRDIDIKPEQTFETFQTAIKDAFNLKQDCFGVFFNADDKYRKGNEVELFFRDKKNKTFQTEICDEVSAPHQKFLYEVFVSEQVSHVFQLELFKIYKEEDKKLVYPAIVKSVGKMPKPVVKSFIAPPVDEEDLKDSDKFFNEIVSSDDEEAYETNELVADLTEEDTASKTASYSIDEDEEVIAEESEEAELDEEGGSFESEEEDY